MNKYARDLLLMPLYEEVYICMTNAIASVLQNDKIRLDTPDFTQDFDSEADLIEFCRENLTYMKTEVAEMYGEDIAELICK